MSTSLGLGTSADLEASSTIEFTELDSDPVIQGSNLKNFNAICDTNREYCAITQKIQAQQSSYFRSYLDKQNNDLYDVIQDRESDASNNEKHRKSHVAERDCYEEIDERMSRKSVEYPEQQAKYVDRWLDDINLPGSNDEQRTPSEWGNVIGIRGFSGSASSCRATWGRSAYNKLKIDHSRLQAEFDKLRKQHNDTVEKFKGTDLLKTFNGKATSKDEKPNKNGQREFVCAGCRCKQQCPINQKQTSSQSIRSCDRHRACEIDELKRELDYVKSKLVTTEQEHDKITKALEQEIEHLRTSSDHKMKTELSKELANLRNQVQTLTLEPSNRLLMTLRNENARLKDLAEVDMVEFEAMKDNYQHLEEQLSSLIHEQQRVEKEKNDENANLMAELCRLQVYQPKLEMILETERSIKIELQKKVDALLDECNQLHEQLDEQSVELNKERMRSTKTESVEIERLQTELAKWQDNYYRLTKEKSDVENLLRSTKAKVSQLDAKHQMELELADETKQRELKQMSASISKLEEESKVLKSKLDERERKFKNIELENAKLTDCVAEMQSKLSNQEPSDTITRQLKMTEGKLEEVSQQLKASESKNLEITGAYESYKLRYEQCKDQVEQLNQRFYLQQRAIDELKEKKEQEMAKLRVDLNFERYNRQVALKGIEKELRNSLKELEAMKYRFSRQLTQSDSIGRSTKMAATKSTATRMVRFEESQNGLVSRQPASLSNNLASKMISSRSNGGGDTS